MTSKTSKDRPQATARAAEIVREYGPFAGADRIHGVTHDGQRVWAATGARLVAFDPASGEPTRTLDRACDAGTAFDGTHLYQIAEARIDKIDPATGDVVASIPAPGHGTDSGLTWAEGSLWVGQYRDRKIHQIDPATGAILRTIESNRFVTGVTWVDGELWHGTWEGRRQRHPPHRPGERRRARAARDAARRRRQRAGVGRRGSLLLRRRSERKGPRRAASERRIEPSTQGLDAFQLKTPFGLPAGHERARHHAGWAAHCRNRTALRAKEHTMNTAIAEAGTVNHPVVSRELWVAERKTLLAHEKELTRLRDQIARERRALPWVRIEKNYVFDAPEGRRPLADLFEGRRQLLVQHFMFAPGVGAGLPELLLHGRPHRRHERAPGASRRHAAGRLARAAGRDRALSPAHGLAVPVGVLAWQRLQPRLRRQLHAGRTGQGRGPLQLRHAALPGEEAPGVSVFYKDDAGEVFHTYSTYGRGVEVMMGTYNMLDLTPKGRDEADVDYKMEWVRHHDRYEPAPLREAGACGQFVLPCPRLKGERAEPAHTQQTSCAGGSEPPGFPLRFRQLCFHLSGLGMLALRSARIEAAARTLLNTEVLICNLGKEKSIYLRS